MTSHEEDRQGVLHDQRGGAEVQHPSADAAPVRARRAAEAVAHRRQHAPVLGRGPRAARDDPVAYPRSRRQPRRRRDHPQHAPQDRADAGRGQRVHGVRQARAGARHRRLGAAPLDRARQIVADRSRPRARRQHQRRRQPKARRSKAYTSLDILRSSTLSDLHRLHALPALRRHRLEADRRRRRPPRRALRLLARAASASSGSPTRTFRSAISTARSRTSPPTTNRSSARLAQARQLAEALPGRRQGPVPRRAARRRQDAPGGRRAEAGRSRRPARAACSTTRAICCASSAAPTIRRSARPSSRCCGR